MYEYFNELLHNICYIITQHELVKDYVEVFINILTGVVIIIGLSYIKPLKEKTLTATFTFWSQLKVRLIGIKEWLQNDNNLINNLYSVEVRDASETLAPKATRVNEFKQTINEVIKFMEAAPDQMPAYIGWHDDYAKLISCFKDMLIYDITNGEEYFKFNNFTKDLKTKEIYCQELCNSIEKICEGIDKRQRDVEKRILKNKRS